MDNKELLNLRPTIIVRLITKIDNYINYTEKRPSSSRQSMNEEIMDEWVHCKNKPIFICFFVPGEHILQANLHFPDMTEWLFAQ